jgi:hypothetical protein
LPFEGINLQEGFDAVVHYDLAWNPTRHEQREGRVDRFGQPKPQVRVVTLWGEDNGIDKLVIDVLVRKHQAIRATLGVSVPVPGAQAVAEALVGGLLLRAGPQHEQLSLDLLPHDTQLILDGWEEAARNEERNRGLFGQHGLDVSEVAAELTAVRDAIGAGADVEHFVRVALNAAGGTVVGEKDGRVKLSLTAVASGLRDAVGRRSPEFSARFDLPVPEGVEYLSRTHPLVEGLATWTLESALDPTRRSVAARTGATRTHAVATRTTILLVRRRYDIELTRGGRRRRLLAEDAAVHAFSGDPTNPSWLPAAEAEALLAAAPAANVSTEQARELVGRAMAAQATWRPHLEAQAVESAKELALTHRRVREGGRQSGARTSVHAQAPVDVLGLYVLTPVPSVR